MLTRLILVVDLKYPGGTSTLLQNRVKTADLGSASSHHRKVDYLPLNTSVGISTLLMGLRCVFETVPSLLDVFNGK